MPSSEVRQNKATGQWVICAPSRAKRPRDAHNDEKTKGELPEWESTCPFCPGNESMLPEIILETPGTGTGQGWQTRVTLNKYPALSPEKNTRRRSEGLYLVMPGYGRHEVLIESPYHNRDIAKMSNQEVGLIIETYHRRYTDLMAAHGSMMTLIFRNHGKRAGTSLIHPHSQIVVTGIVPQHIRLREEAAQRFFDDWGCCVYCEMLKQEIREKVRMVDENESFAAFVPFAAEVPYEIWALPKRHAADFGSLYDAEKEDLAMILRTLLANLHDRLEDPDYNYIINTSAQFRANEPQLHWYFQIRPRLTTPAGFEIGSGISINPSLPETDAAFLRSGSG